MGDNITIDDAAQLINDAMQEVTAHNGHLAQINAALAQLKTQLDAATTARDAAIEARDNAVNERHVAQTTLANLQADYNALLVNRANLSRAYANSRRQTLFSNLANKERTEALNLSTQVFHACLATPNAVPINVLIGFANTIWVAYSKRTRYRANRRVSIRAKFIEQLNMALVTPLTVEQVAEIRYGERPDLNGPGNNPIL